MTKVKDEVRPDNSSRRGAQPSPGIGDDGDSSLGKVARDVLEDAIALMRAEARVLRAELRQGVVTAKRGLALIAVGAALGLGAVVMALVTVMAILSALGLPGWIAALLTTVAAIAGAARLAQEGMRELRRNIALSTTTEQLEQDRAMVQEKFR